MPAVPQTFWAILMDGKFVSFTGSAPVNCRYWCREGDKRWTEGWITFMEEKIGPAPRTKTKSKTPSRKSSTTGNLFNA